MAMIVGWLLLIFIAATALLTVLFPFGVFRGWFDGRVGGAYRFRVRRFVTVVLVLLVLNGLAGLAAFPLFSAVTGAAATSALDDAQRNRETQIYMLDNMAVMFPRAAGGEGGACMQVALANYVDDQWKAFYRQLTCNGNFHVCANDDGAYRVALLQTVPVRRGLPGLLLAFQAMNESISKMWQVAGQGYNVMRRFAQIPDPKTGRPPAAPDSTMLATYQSYFAQCRAMKAPVWAAAEAPFLVSPVHLCMGTCR